MVTRRSRWQVIQSVNSLVWCFSMSWGITDEVCSIIRAFSRFSLPPPSPGISCQAPMTAFVCFWIKRKRGAEGKRKRHRPDLQRDGAEGVSPSCSQIIPLPQTRSIPNNLCPRSQSCRTRSMSRRRRGRSRRARRQTPSSPGGRASDRVLRVAFFPFLLLGAEDGLQIVRDKGEYLLAKRIARSHIEPFGRLFQQLGEERNPLVSADAEHGPCPSGRSVKPGAAPECALDRSSPSIWRWHGRHE
jgi:hypothetical protein